MATVFFLCLLIGFIWALVGYLMVKVAYAGMSISRFYYLGCLLFTPVAWVFFPDWVLIAEGRTPNILVLATSLFFSAALTAIGQILVIKAIRLGRKAPTFAIAQSAIVFPFVASIFIGGESHSSVEYLGLVTIIIGVVANSCSGSVKKIGRKMIGGPGTDPMSAKWLLASLFAWTCLGLSQVFTTLPSLLYPEPDPAKMRVPLLFASLVICYGIISSRAPKAVPTQSITGLSICWSTLAGCSYFLLFKTLDTAQVFNLVGLVYPLVTGTAIFSLSLLSICFFKESLNRRSLLGILLILVGVLMMAVPALASAG